MIKRKQKGKITKWKATNIKNIDRLQNVISLRKSYSTKDKVKTITYHQAD